MCFTGNVRTAHEGRYASNVPKGLGDGCPCRGSRSPHCAQLTTGALGPPARGEVVLAGLPDVDPAELRLIDERGVSAVPPGPDFAERLTDVVGQRPVYVHLDRNALEPGIVPTDYRVPDGLDLAELAELTSLSVKAAPPAPRRPRPVSLGPGLRSAPGGRGHGRAGCRHRRENRAMN